MPEFATVNSSLSLEWVIRLASLLFLSLISGWTWSRHFASTWIERSLWALLIGMHAIPLALFFPVAFSSFSVIAASILVASTGWLSTRTKNPLPFPVDRDQKRLLVCLGIILIALWCFWTLRTQLFTHYDYFLNSNLMSLDLARTGSKASPWAVEHDIHNWFLVQLTSTIALDAIEMQWLHSNTNILPRLLELLTMVGVISLLVRRSRSGAVFFTLLCAFFLFEQSIQFRPHLFVGLFVAMAALILGEEDTSTWKIMVLAICLALSKRDGLVLAPILIMLSFKRFKLIRHGALGLGLIFLAAAFLKIGGRTPLLFLYQSLSNWKNLQAALALASDPLFLSAILAYAYLVWRTFDIVSARRPLVLCAMTILLTLAGSLILIDAGFLTPGTNERKILYIVAPTITALLCRYTWPATLSLRVKNRQEFLNVFFSVLLICLASEPLANAAKVSTNWSNGAINGARYLRSLLKDSTHTLKIGVYKPQENSIDLSAFGDLYTFKWPFLVAYDGNKISFLSDPASFHEYDVVYLPPGLSEKERLDLANTHGFSYYQTYGVYGLLLKPGIQNEVNFSELKTGPAGEALLNPTEMIELASSENNWNVPPGSHILDTLYPKGKLLQQIIWPEQAALFLQPAELFFPNQEKRIIRQIEFQTHPLGGKYPSRIEVEVDQKRISYDANHVIRNGTFSIPVHSDKPVKLYFYNDLDASTPWKAPYFFIFSLKAETDVRH